MAVDQGRYRQLDFIGARILQARELNWLQDMDQGVAVADDSTSVDGQLQSIFRQGALYNTNITTSGLTITLSQIQGGIPMMVFVRDRWEIFPRNNDDTTDSLGTVSGNATLTMPNTPVANVYLNWELKIRTGGLIGDDPTLTDALTNEAVASAGELILHVSYIDTSGVALSGSQLAKNTSPIILVNGTVISGNINITALDNVQTQAFASNITSGLVKTTTSSPLVVSTNDPRMTDGRNAADGSVHDSTVRTPVAAGGTNADGTPTYNLSGDIGGISAAKIVYTAGTQLVSDFIGWIKTNFNNLSNAFTAHATAALGLINTHPLPTAAQVGAAPISHVGQVLGQPTSHPPVVNANSGGFQLNRSTGGGTVDDEAYGVFVTGSPIVSLNHDGDVFSSKSGAFTATPGGALAAGALSHLGLIAQVLSQHVNQISHANPHGLAAGDIGAATTGYVDTSVANVLANAENYTNTQFSSGFAVNKSATGFLTLPTALGLIILQWGRFNGNTNGEIIPYGIPFPNAALTVVLTGINGSANLASISRTSFTANAGSGGQIQGVQWIAVGY